MQEKYLERRSCNLFYRLWPGAGARQLLVLCHGFSSNGTRWREFAQSTPLLEDCQILAPDLRGHGRSIYRGRLRSEDWVEDLAALLDTEGFDRAIIGGHCLGANLALRFANTYPNRTQGLILVEPMFPEALSGPLGKLHRVRVLLPLLALIVRGFNRVGVYRRRVPEVNLTELDRQFRAVMAESGSRDAVRKRYGSPRHDMLHMTTSAYLQALHEVVRPLPDPSPVQAPALSLLSRGALFGDPEITRECLSRIPDIQIEELDALHWIPTEAHEQMGQLLEAWSRRLIQAPRPDTIAP